MFVGGSALPATADGLTTPEDVTVEQAGSDAVTLSWDESENETGWGATPAYHVYSGSHIVATSMGTSVTVSSLEPDTSYEFTVEAYDKDGTTSDESDSVSATTKEANDPEYRKTAYFDQWSVYGNDYHVKDVDTSGAADELTTIVYAFENISADSPNECFEAVKAADTDDSNPDAGDGAGDAFADYQKSYGADESVDGTADGWDQPLAGNFNQLRELKAKHPNLKVLLSLGGWTYSKYFSDAAESKSSREHFVSSCVDMFLKGNLPSDVQGGDNGGDASAAGIFDGIDIDWEYPGSDDGHPGNHHSSDDTENFTKLLEEFRDQLDDYGDDIGKKFELQAALPGGQDKLDKIETDKIGDYLDYGNVMTYDMHGAWDEEGPTNFQDPVHGSPDDPSDTIEPGDEHYTIDNTIEALTDGSDDYDIAGGFPAEKLTMGFPFYYRGWTGVSEGDHHGRYEEAEGPSKAYSDSETAGLADYKELKKEGLTGEDDVNFYDDDTKAHWIYDGDDFYTGDDPTSIATKDDYIKDTGMGGAMMFALESDDSDATLLHAVADGLGDDD